MRENQERRYTIAIMLGDMQSDYAEELLQGFYTCAQKEDVNIVFLMGPQIPQYCMDVFSGETEGDYNYQFDTVYSYAHFTKPDAMIITYAALAYFKDRWEKKRFLDKYADIPYLLLGETPEDSSLPYMMADNYKGMRACIEHLALDHGYRKIAFLSGPEYNLDANERLQAYLDVMREHGFPVIPTMVAHGNYTEQVKEQVEELLDRNPGLEAIACANDNMAKCCYRVCAARNLRVGTDIAITGFDDVELARTMDPLLTSVSQNSFQFSYVALRNAIALCENKTAFAHRMPVALHKRESCGCNYGQMHSCIFTNHEEKEQYVVQTVGNVARELLSVIPYQKERNHYSGLILDYFHHVYQNICNSNGKELDMEYLIKILKELTAYNHMPISLLLEYFSNVLQVLSSNADTAREQEQLMEVLNATEQYIHFTNVSKLEQEVMESNRKSWFVPSFIRDLTTIAAGEGLSKALLHIMNRFQMMKVKSCYIYLFDTPVIHESGMNPKFPKEMYLNAWFSEEEMVCYQREERPLVTVENGFSSFIRPGASNILTTFVLFSGVKQYGMMLCEVNQKDIAFLQICSLQFGSLLRFLELNQMERESQRELQKSLRTIQEQNHILSFVSEYDELTHLLNRRGFMERAIRCCQQSEGKKAYLIFGDLDHLKEINDCFGHAAGDFAISNAAKYLQEALPSGAITARIGGDEFMALALSEKPNFKEVVMGHLHKIGESFNKRSEKPYYVEISVGIYEFCCDAQIDLNELIQKSDELLYQAKAVRRKSVKKVKTPSAF